MSNDNIWQEVLAAMEVNKPIITTNNDDLVQRVEAYEPLLLLKSPRDPRVLGAMRRVDRRVFIPPVQNVLTTEEAALFPREYLEAVYGISGSDDYPAEIPNKAIYNDEPVSIGYGQTCSQPSVVALMADLLRIETGMRILEVGAGCGYSAAILAELVGSSGHVTSVEQIPGLVSLAQQNLKTHFGPGYQERVSVVLADGSMGWAEKAPYDAVILTAGIQPRLFDFAPLIQQVPDGVFLYPEFMGPITQEIYKNGCLKARETFGHFSFVPLRRGVIENHETP